MTSKTLLGAPLISNGRNRRKKKKMKRNKTYGSFGNSFDMHNRIAIVFGDVKEEIINE